MVQYAKPLNPFIVFCQKTIPLAFDESMSYMEAIYALKAYLENEIVPTVNTNAQAVSDLTNLVNQLQDYVEHYFDNLDVQEEINNKLDAMAEAGTLQEIITAYIQANVAWTFDTVADMKSATNLVAGSYAKTLGFYSLNDGGGAIYKISNTGTVNEANVIAVGELFAHLVYGTSINVKQFGCYCDDTHDDSSALQTGLNNMPNYVTEVIFNNNTDMLLSNVIDLTDISGIYFKFKGKIHRTSSAYTNFCFRLTRCKNCKFEKSFIYSERDQEESAPSGHTRQSQYGSNIIGYILYQCYDVDFIDCKFNNTASDFFNQPISSEDLTISNNINIDGWVSTNSSHPLFMQYCENVHINNANVTPAQNMGGGDHHLYFSKSAKNVFVTNSIFTSPDKYLGVSINFLNTGSNANYDNCPKNLVVSNCKFKLYYAFLTLSFTSNAIIDNCEIDVLENTETHPMIALSKEPTMRFTNNTMIGDWNGGLIYDVSGSKLVIENNTIINNHLLNTSSFLNNSGQSSVSTEACEVYLLNNIISWQMRTIYYSAASGTYVIENNNIKVKRTDGTGNSYIFSFRKADSQTVKVNKNNFTSDDELDGYLFYNNNITNDVNVYFNTINGSMSGIANGNDIAHINNDYNVNL